MPRASGTSRLGSDATTRGIRVRVSPRFLPEQSDAGARQFVFAYRVRIRNDGDAPARLVSRHWIIVDAHGRRHEVEGDGVVGHQPRLEPGQTFDYASYCPLPTAWGTMEGSYRMVRDDGEAFEVRVARFFLVSDGPE